MSSEEKVSPNASAQLRRQWDLLNLIPRHDSPATIVALAKKLAPLHGGIDEHGEVCSSFIRKVQHDLKKLSEVVTALKVDKRDGGNEYKVSWARNAPPLKLSGMSTAERIAFGVLKKTGMGLLPHTTFHALEPYFAQAISDSGWLSKIARQPDTLAFIPAPIDSAVEDAVHAALYNGDCLSIDYRNASGELSCDRIILPLALVQRRATTYLVAVSRGRNTALNYAMHRIQRAAITVATIEEPADFSLQDHLATGITNPIFPSEYYGQLISLELRVDRGTRNWIAETPLSEDQKITFEGEASLVKATVPVSEELVHWILSMGACVYVLSPSFLRERVGATAAKMAALYSVKDSQGGDK